ncbi:uncharacterized conserved protein [Longilinea arvoryzae]|uniref:Uncharacterized conserved protein n=1 Tax=Longilinea arvoryzae TaxID=360412 RepID=A0A0S7B7P2_9CHLR|nr:DUF362 domain-containing protein [Longilinea arvoryzae]GAP13452.1 uncharacterized conserved protein [Longilinea arvoryzae]
MVKKISRRQFLLSLLGAGAAGLTWSKTKGVPFSVESAGGNTVYLPFISKASPTPPPGTGHGVVHVHHSSVSTWNGNSGDYWNYVNQAKTSQMVEQGLIQLTGKSTAAAAWRARLPNYQAGQGIAIKVNFNNTISSGCSAAPTAINALPQVVNAVIAGLKSMGVAESDIWIYDGVSRTIPNYFYNIVHTPYPGVKFYDKCHTPVTYNSTDASATVSFSPPAGVPQPAAEKIADVLVNARYLINMPILKNHSCAGITLGFKNHFGTINNPGGLHSHVFYEDSCGGGAYSNYSPLVDIYKNANIRNKTVLTIGDGIFGALGAEDARPSFWTTFNDQVPQSLFFAADPVAIDSVMADFLRAEWGYPTGSDRYLQFAENAGLGVYEQGDPWGGGYSQIDYYKVNLS